MSDQPSHRAETGMWAKVRGSQPGQESFEEVFHLVAKHQVEHMVKVTLRQNETIQEAIRRFRKLAEISGLRREVRWRQYYEEPSHARRRARLRAERRALRNGNLSGR